MNPEVTPADRTKVQEEMDRLLAEAEKVSWRDILKMFATGAGAFFLMVISFRDRTIPWSELSTAKLALMIGSPLVGAAITTWLATWFSHRDRPLLDPDEYAADLDRKVENLSGPGWMRRTIIRGLGLGLVVGTLAGSLAAMGGLGDSLNSVPMGMAVLGVSLLLMAPLAFVVRRVELKTLLESVDDE